MRAAVYLEPGIIEPRELPRVVLGPGDLLLRVEACGVCGSDVASYVHGHYATCGQVLGHEISAIVQQLGQHLASSGAIEIGDRVAVRPARSCKECDYCAAERPGLCSESGALTLGYGTAGGFAESVLIVDAVIGSDVLKVPGDISPEEVLWAEPLAVGVHALRRAHPPASANILVLGGGSVGLCVAAAALARDDVKNVFVLEPRDQRRAAAVKLGAKALEIFELPAAGPFGTVIDTSGSAQAIAGASSRLSPGGNLVLVGLSDQRIPWPIGPSGYVPSFAYSDEDFRDAVELIVAGRVRLGQFISHRYGLSETGEAIAASANDPSVVKATIWP